MSNTALYTDLSHYYDLMCSDIDYRAQSQHIHRLYQLLGNGGSRYLDMACGTGPHLRHFIDLGYRAHGMDLHPPMLDIAQRRCPEAELFQADMTGFTTHRPFDLITCFLYSIHYTQTIDNLKQCMASVHAALSPGGVFCFNAVDKTTIDNRRGVRHSVDRHDSQLVFHSSWHYAGRGDEQQLRVRIEKTQPGSTEIWEDQHAMVAVSFSQLKELLNTCFEVHVFEHSYDRIEPWGGSSGNGIFACIK